MRTLIRSMVAACVLALVAGCVFPLLAGCERPEAARSGLEPAVAAAPEWLFPVWVKGKWGFIDETGRMRIEPRFDGTGGFSPRAMLLRARSDLDSPWLDDEWWNPGDKDAPLAKSLAPVLVGGKWGFIDATGRMVITPKFDMASWFSEGRAAVNIGWDSNRATIPGDNGWWGYIDSAGEWVVKPQFRDAGEFHEGLARVRFELKYGFIDSRGQWAIEPTLEKAGERFSGGLAWVKSAPDARPPFGYVDRTGRFVIPPRFFYCRGFSDGLAVTDDWQRPLLSGCGIYCYTDSGGHDVIGPYDYAMDFSEGLAAVNRGGVWQRDFPSSFFIGGGFWGYVDTKGKEAIPLQFEYAGPFSEGLAAVQVMLEKRREFYYFDPWTWGCVVSRIGPIRWGFIDKTGKYVIPPTFKYIYGGFYHGIAKVEKDGRTCYINKSGAVIWRDEPAEP